MLITALESLEFKDIVGTELKLIDNDDYYVKTDRGTFIPGTDYSKMYNLQEKIDGGIDVLISERRELSIRRKFTFRHYFFPIFWLFFFIKDFFNFIKQVFYNIKNIFNFIY